MHRHIWSFYMILQPKWKKLVFVVDSCFCQYFLSCSLLLCAFSFFFCFHCVFFGGGFVLTFCYFVCLWKYSIKFYTLNMKLLLAILWCQCSFSSLLFTFPCEKLCMHIRDFSFPCIWIQICSYNPFFRFG